MKAIKGTTVYKHAEDFAKVMHVMEALCDTSVLDLSGGPLARG